MNAVRKRFLMTVIALTFSLSAAWAAELKCVFTYDQEDWYGDHEFRIIAGQPENRNLSVPASGASTTWMNLGDTGVASELKITSDQSGSYRVEVTMQDVTGQSAQFKASVMAGKEFSVGFDRPLSRKLSCTLL